MQISLTIASDNPDDLARVLAALGAGGAPVTVTGSPVPTPQPMPSVATTDSDDDDGAPADPNAPAVDSAGLPWDERIHSSSRKTGKDGTWNKRRGGPSGAELAAIEAELRARSAPPMPTAQPQPVPVMPQPTPVYTPPMPDPTAQPQPIPAYVPPAAQPMPIPPQPVPVAQPIPVAAPVAGVVEAPIPTAQPTDFHSFIQEVSTRTGRSGSDGAPLIHAEYLAQLSARVAQATGFAMNSVMDLAQRPDLIPFTVQLMQMDGRW